MNDKSRIFFWCLFLYTITALIALGATAQHVKSPQLDSLVKPLEMTPQDAFIFVAVFILFTVVMVRFVRVARASLSFLLGIALIAGSQFIFSAWVSPSISIVLAVALVSVLQFAPLVITHDIAIMLGIGGIAGVLGLSLTPLVACVVLAILSLYDVVSVYRTRHMVTMAGTMIASGSVFGFLIPASIQGFFMQRSEALDARSVMMLGSGDIGLPLILATSALSQSWNAALLVAVFSLGGLASMQWLFMHQKEPAPMAALPPIALSAILGYVCAILLGI